MTLTTAYEPEPKVVVCRSWPSQCTGMKWIWWQGKSVVGNTSEFMNTDTNFRNAISQGSNDSRKQRVQNSSVLRVSGCLANLVNRIHIFAPSESFIHPDVVVLLRLFNDTHGNHPSALCACRVVDGNAVYTTNCLFCLDARHDISHIELNQRLRWRIPTP